MTKFEIYAVFLGLTLIEKCTTSDSKYYDNYNEDDLEEIYGKVIHVSVIFRHGDRTPYAPYPLDPYKNYVWSESYGHLTNAGKKRLYNLGKWFRKRYNDLVEEKYSSDEILMQSSDFDRTLMSAGTFLAGFYPPTESESWNEDNLKWQPIPIHSIPLEYDNMIVMIQMCDVYNQELFAANYAPAFKEMFKAHEMFFNYVGLNTGIMFSEYFIGFGLMKIMEIYDSLNVQQQHNLPLPEWSESVFPEPMARMALRLFEFGTFTEKMRRLKSGPFLKSLKTDMMNKAEDNLEQKMHFYSGHDATIATIMITLGIFNYILPPYGSALIFELRKKDSQFYVTILYKNTTENQQPYLIELTKCGSRCTVDNFFNITEPFITDDWKADCKVENEINNLDTWPFNTIQTIFLMTVIMFLTSTMLYFHIQRNKEKYSKYFCKTEKND